MADGVAMKGKATGSKAGNGVSGDSRKRSDQGKDGEQATSADNSQSASQADSATHDVPDPSQDDFWWEKVDADPYKLGIYEKTILFHNLDGKGNPTSVNDSRIFEYIKHTHHLFILGDMLYIYDGGYYREDTRRSIGSTLIRGCMLEQFIKSNTIKRIYELIMQDASLDMEAEDTNRYAGNWINFKNGMYNAITGQLTHHRWDLYSTVQLPWEYDPKADHGSGVETEKFLRYAIPNNEDREMLLEYAGLCCTIDTRQQKMLIMCGDGGTGKSTVINLIQDLVGKRNCSNVPMSKLTEKFTVVFMMGKLLNACADLEIDALDDVSTIKQLIGEDEIKAEHKGKAVFSFENFSKMLFSTNELPLVRNEKTDGFYRRLLVLTMNEKPAKRDPDLKDRLKKELPYFLHICMQALKRMYHRGAILVSENSIKATQQLRNDSDTIEAFLSEKCVRGSSSDQLERKDLYEKYAEYCKDWDRQSHTKNNFFKALRNKGFPETKSSGTYYFRMIRWKNEDEDGFMQVDDAEDEGVPFEI